MVQLVPTAAAATQPAAPEAEDVEPPKKPESSTAEAANIPLKLPRAMRSAASNSSLLRDRNSEQGEQPGVNKESGDPARRSPIRRAKKSDEKENLGL